MLDEIIRQNPEAMKRLSRYEYGKYQLAEDEAYSDSTQNTIICKVCGKPKRSLVWDDRLGNLRYALYENIGCDCDRQREIESFDMSRARDLKAFYNGEKYLRSVGDTFRYSEFDTVNPRYLTDESGHATMRMKEWCEAYHRGNRGISLVGDKGNGKTTAMACSRNMLLDRGFSCVLATDKQIVDDVIYARNWDGEFSYETYKIVDVLIIDDLGAGIKESNAKRLDMVNEALFDVVNSRYASGKTICITSNLNLDDLVSRGLDSRISDRLTEMVPEVIAITGESIRQIKAREYNGQLV